MQIMISALPVVAGVVKRRNIRCHASQVFAVPALSEGTNMDESLPYETGYDGYDDPG